jgi:hypothetical protein
MKGYRRGEKIILEDLQWLVDSFYTLEFKHDHDITERVIFPMSNSESRGICPFCAFYR